MASLTKKIINGHAYYYYRECRRVNGKPKIVKQHYLGRAEDIFASLTAGPGAPVPSPKPKHALVADFGAVAALYDLSRRLELAETIDRHVSKRGSGPTVGTYLLAAVLNRCVAPCSKASLAEWYNQTILPRLLPVQARQLTSQRFWDNMDRVSSQVIQSIEAELVQRLVEIFHVDLGRVLFDATNFFTFIDTFNERSTLAQRGHSKEGRDSLRIVGLALLVTADFHLPLLHRTYPGNQTDAPTFASLIDDLTIRYRQLVQGAEHVTLVFDKGNNSGDNLDAIAQGPYHFIGSLVATHHRELLLIPRSKFRSLESVGLAGVSAYRTRKIVFGVERTVLVTHNENLFDAQRKTLLREIAKRQQRLHDLQRQLQKHHRGTAPAGKKPTVAATQKKVDELLRTRQMKDLLQTQVTEKNGLPLLTYRFHQKAWNNLQRTELGKTLLFTDNDDWADAEIVAGYRSQHHVETAFRCMKDTAHITLRPQHHWTDQKVEVHVFCCVLALLLCSLLERELHRKGIDRSIPDLLDTLGQIREVAVVYAPEGNKRLPTVQTTLSEMNADQQTLFDALELSRYKTA